MNQREKEEYLREYGVLKSQGKPFFPYAIAKDSAMACVVMAIIIALSLIFGAELGPKANPATTSYDARPDWYFFFLFDILRIIRTPSIVPLATIGVPTIAMILLFLLPFYDRRAERRPEHRPIATVAGIFVIGAMAYLTYQGANAGTPDALEIATPAAVIANGPTAVAKWNEGTARGRPVRLRGMPHDRRQRQPRPGPQPHAHRLADPERRDRTHARESHGADAFVQKPAAAEVPGGRQLPLADEVAGERRRPWFLTDHHQAPGPGRSRRGRCGRCSTASHRSTTC